MARAAVEAHRSTKWNLAPGSSPPRGLDPKNPPKLSATPLALDVALPDQTKEDMLSYGPVELLTVFSWRSSGMHGCHNPQQIVHPNHKMSIQKRTSWRDLILVRTILWRLGRQTKTIEPNLHFFVSKEAFNATFTFEPVKETSIILQKRLFWFPPVNKHSNGKSPSWIGNTSSNGGCPIAMLVYWRVSFCGIFPAKIWGHPAVTLHLWRLVSGSHWRSGGTWEMGFSVWKGRSMPFSHSRRSGKSLTKWRETNIGGTFHVPVNRIHRFKLHSFRWSHW